MIENDFFSNNTNFVNKLGSLSSHIEKSDGYFYKKYIMQESYLTENYKDHISNFNEDMLGTLHYPEKIETKKLKNGFVSIVIKQKELSPFLTKNSISSMHLYDLGCLILNQQKYLLNKNLTFYDARPDNYWLKKNNNKLIDIGSIQKLSLQNLYSFEQDFINHFIYPLLIEKSNEIPVSCFFNANMQKYKINILGNLHVYKSLSFLKFAIIKNLKDVINIFIVNSNTSFVSFLNSIKTKDNNFEPIKRKGRKINQYLHNLLLTLKPKINKSQWTGYTQFHDKQYSINKKAIFQRFSEECNHSGLVDLGSNLTFLNEKDIKYRVDNDINICNEIYINQINNNFVSLVDISNALLGKSYESLHLLNPDNKFSSAIMISIIHHLIIGDGLSPNLMFFNLSKIYKYILLEYPLIEDPMVQLLSNKRNEYVNWGWENNHEIEAKKYFDVTEFEKLSNTRRIFLLTRR